MFSRTSMLTARLSQLSIGAAKASATPGTTRSFHMVSSSASLASSSQLSSTLSSLGQHQYHAPLAHVSALTLLNLEESNASHQIRTFASGRNRKAIDEKQAKRLKIQAKKKKNKAPQSAAQKAEEDSVEKKVDQPFLQHQEWVKFQQAISVDGFQTGQTTTPKVLGTKAKGGKRVRKQRERELARLQGGSGDASSVKFPAIRYSEEETQRLLAEAFASLPERAGKRGSRNRKRQSRRWFLVRKIRAKYKQNRIWEHEGKMVKRQEKRHATLKMKMETAPKLKSADLDYQRQLLEKWAARIVDGEAFKGDESTKLLANSSSD